MSLMFSQRWLMVDILGNRTTETAVSFNGLLLEQSLSACLPSKDIQEERLVGRKSFKGWHPEKMVGSVITIRQKITLENLSGWRSYYREGHWAESLHSEQFSSSVSPPTSFPLLFG